MRRVFERWPAAGERLRRVFSSRITLSLALFVGLVSGAEAFDSAFVAYADGGRLIHTDDPSGREFPLRRNAPLSPGDVLEARGRVEAVLPGGAIAFLDARSRASLISLDDQAGGNSVETVLDLENGRLALGIPAGYPEIRVDLPDASAYLEPSGFYLLDASSRGSAISVLRGDAELATAGGAVRVRSGEARILAGGAIRAFGIRHDEFENWALARVSRRENGSNRLPARLRWCSSDLDAGGRWSFVASLGAWGWSPSVASWHPYRDGSWLETSSGLTWWPDEEWGWATSHYGSWVFVDGRWIWVADDVYSPAWVYWYSDADYVGWAPVGYWDAWGGGSSLSFGFHSDWSGGSVRFSAVDAVPWTMVAYDRFRSSAPTVSVATYAVAPAAVQRASLRSGPGLLVAQPIAASPRRFRNGLDFAKASLPRTRRPASAEVTSLFAAPGVRRNPPAALRPLLASGKAERNVGALVRLSRLSSPRTPAARAASPRQERWRVAPRLAGGGTPAPLAPPVARPLPRASERRAGPVDRPGMAGPPPVMREVPAPRPRVNGARPAAPRQPVESFRPAPPTPTRVEPRPAFEPHRPPRMARPTMPSVVREPITPHRVTPDVPSRPIPARPMAAPPRPPAAERGPRVERPQRPAVARPARRPEVQQEPPPQPPPAHQPPAEARGRKRPPKR